MGTKWQRTSINLPKNLGPSEREAIAQEIIDFMIERSQSGLDKDGNPFPKYTKQYAKEKGVSIGDVDLTLSSEMLNNIELLSSYPGKIIVGFERGSNENAKADGNIRGTYGRDSEDPSKARDFLGISDSDLETILSKYTNDEQSIASTLEYLIAQDIAKKSASKIGFDLGI